jgi:DNA-binding response OmpR family regulator
MKKILVVDDKAELRSLLKAYLSQENYQVVMGRKPSSWPAMRSPI